MKTLVATKLPLVLAVGIATQAWAEAPAVENSKVQVWGTQISNASSLLSEDIELKQADHLSDLLRDQPGVDIGGAHSTNQRINIRGMQDLDLDIRIDGARQNNFMYHHMGNLLINADILKAVDLQVGTNSVINGGLSGGAAFETKDAKDLLKAGQKVGARLHASVASNDYFGYSATAYSQLNDQLDLLAYFNTTNRNNPEDGSGNESIGNDGEIDNALVKLGLDINQANRVEFSYDKYTDEGDYAPRADMGALTNAAITDSTVYPTEFERETLTLNYELDLGDAINLRATLYQNTMHLWRDEALNSRASYRYAEGESVNRGLNLLAESVLDGESVMHTLRYGLETYKHETERLEDGALVRPEEATSLALFVEDAIEFENGFVLTPGARYNRYQLETSASDKTFTDTTLGLAAAYPLTDAWTLRASSTQLFQGPNLSEVFSSSTSAANPELKAETGINHELGVSYEESGIAGLDRLNFSLTLFQTDLDDYIDDEGNGTLENVGDYRLRGFEASVGLSQGNLDARLSYAHSGSENRETGAALAREVGDSIALGLDYYIPSQNLALNWTSQFILEEEYYEKPAFDVHSLSANWTPVSIQGLTLTAGIENIFDEYYASHASRIGDANHPVFGALHLTDYEPGRNFKLSASYSF